MKQPLTLSCRSIVRHCGVRQVRQLARLSEAQERSVTTSVHATKRVREAIGRAQRSQQSYRVLLQRHVPLVTAEAQLQPSCKQQSRTQCVQGHLHGPRPFSTSDDSGHVSVEWHHGCHATQLTGTRLWLRCLLWQFGWKRGCQKTVQHCYWTRTSH